MMPSKQKPVLLWVVVKLFDKSVDKATYLEMLKELESRFEVHFLTAYRDRPLPAEVCGRPIHYFPKRGRGHLARIWRRAFLLRTLRRVIKAVGPDHVLLGGQGSRALMRCISRLRKEHEFAAFFDVRTLPVGSRRTREY